MSPTPMTGPAQAATPTAFPAPGVYGVTQRVTLRSATPGATIRYTLDGADPDESSPIFDPYRLPVLEADDAGGAGGRAAYTLKAVAAGAGLAPSPVATFSYRIDRRSAATYLTSEVRPGVWMIRDFDDTKIYLVIGSARALLVDAGLGTGDLRGLVAGMIGDLPLDLVVTHGHPDHIAAMGQFQDGPGGVYMNHRDLPMVRGFVERLGYPIDLDLIADLREGAVFDLGDRRLTVYEVPGHSPGHVVLFDEANRLLLASDAFGSNRPAIPDSLWMQFPGMAPIDDYLSSLQVFRAKVAGKIGEIYGGHNDLPFVGEAYLDNLERAAQLLVDRGEEVLVPSLRPTDAWQVVVGDRLSDPDWAAINVAKGRCLSAPPDQIATLSNLQIQGARLEPGFTPHGLAYTALADAAGVTLTPTATSGRHRGLTIDGAPHPSGAPLRIELGGAERQVTIVVTAPDGATRRSYTVALRRAP